MTSATRNDLQIGENTDPTKNLFIQVLEDGQAVISRGSRGGTLVQIGKIDANGNLLAKKPIVVATTSSAQALTTGVQKLIFNTIIEDSNSWFSNSRFQPTIPGWYRIAAATGIAPTNGRLAILYMKNGSSGVYMIDIVQCYRAKASALVHFNGTTDYVEVQVFAGTATNNEAAHTFFEAELVSAD